MPLSFATDTITLLTPGTLTDHGNTIDDWTTQVTSLTVDRCIVQPVPGSEVLIGRDLVVTRWRCLAPAGTPATAYKGAVWQGVTYQIDGPPQVQDSPTGALAHVEIALKLVTG